MRSDRQDLVAALAPLAHMPTWLTVTAERAVSRCMGGSCSMPLAAHARFEGDQLPHRRRLGATPKGRMALVRASAQGQATTLEQANALGEGVAAQLRAGGATG